MNAIILVLCCVICISKGEGNVCNGNVCNYLGTKFSKCMSTQNQPCDDFYMFTCGTSVDEKEQNQEEVDNDTRLKQLFEEEPEYDRELHKYLKTFYSACNNMKQIDETGTKPIKDLLKAVGGWPALGNWNQQGWSVEQTEINLIKTGFESGSLFETLVVEDRENPKNYIIMIKPGVLWLSYNSLSNDDSDELKQYQIYMIDVAKLFDIQDKVAEEEQKNTLNFEKSLTKILSVSDGMIQGNLERLKLKDLVEKNKLVNWLNFFKSIAPSDVTISEEDIVEVTDLEYLNKLAGSIKGHEKEAANLMIWHALRQLIEVRALPSNIVKKLDEMNEKLGDSPYDDPREEFCTYWTSFRLPLATSYFYSKRFVSEASKKAVMDISNHISMELKDEIDKLNWMEENTRKEAKIKLSGVKTSIGVNTDVTKVLQVYSDLHLDKDSYVKSVLAINIWRTKLSFRGLKKPIVETKWWYRTSYWEHTEYNYEKNEIFLPGGLLQRPYFDPNFPKYANYARIGQVIGKLLLEAIGIKKNNFYSDNKEINWWSQNTLTMYKAKNSCLKQQLSNQGQADTIYFSHDTLDLLSDEILVQHGAVKLAYKAYQKLGLIEESLPNLKTYSSNQLFWLAGANLLCEELKYDRYAVNGPYSLMPDFVTAFHCTTKPLDLDIECAIL